MDFKNKLEKAYYEITAPGKQELLNDAEKVDKKIEDDSLLQKSIDELKSKIQISQTWKQRSILEEQLEELEKLHDLYSKYKNIKLTQKTKEEIDSLFKWITSQLSLEKEQIHDDYDKIQWLIKKEEMRLMDTIEIKPFSIRDFIEDKIDIIWTLESFPPQKYQDFFDIATIEYINILESKLWRKLTDKENKKILAQKGLLLDKKDLKIFSENIANQLPDNYNFKYKVKLFNDKIIELNNKQTTKSKKRKININELFNEVETKNNYDKLPTNEKMKKIEDILNNPKNEKFLLEVISKLENKVISIDHKKIKLTKEFINEHKKELLNNLKTLILMIIHIESDWNYKAKNLQKSSWKGLWQWLDWNWRYSEEYIFDKKWYTKKQLLEKFNTKSFNQVLKKIYKTTDLTKLKKNKKIRTTWNTSSFETTLKWIYYWYLNDLLDKLDFKIPKKYDKPIKLSPIDLNLEQQIQLLILDIGINWKTVKNKLWQTVWIKDFMWTALLWNSWAVKEIYKIFHHTKPDKKTLTRIKTISPKYTKKLIKLY